MLGGTHAIEWYLIFLLHEPHVKVLKNLLLVPTGSMEGRCRTMGLVVGRALPVEVKANEVAPGVAEVEQSVG